MLRLFMVTTSLLGTGTACLTVLVLGACVYRSGSDWRDRVTTVLSALYLAFIALAVLGFSL